MRRAELERLAQTIIGKEADQGEDEYLAGVLGNHSLSVDYRLMAAMRLGFMSGEAPRTALGAALAGDPDRRVRFVAAQALLYKPEGAKYLADVAKLIADMAAENNRDSLDTAVHAAEAVAQFARREGAGGRIQSNTTGLAAVSDAVESALAASIRLKSRHRRQLSGLAKDFTRVPESTATSASESFYQVPGDLADGEMRRQSFRGSDWMHAGTRAAMVRLRVRPAEATVELVEWLLPHGVALAVTSFILSGRHADELQESFAKAFTKPPGGQWTQENLGGRLVQVARGKEWTSAWWARDGIVTKVDGGDEDVIGAVARLP